MHIGPYIAAYNQANITYFNKMMLNMSNKIVPSSPYIFVIVQVFERFSFCKGLNTHFGTKNILPMAQSKV